MLTDERVARLQQVASKRSHDVVVLENIHDPHNAAAAFRNCDAFGVQTVHVIFETEKEFNPEKLGKLTSASANKWLEIHTWESTESCFNYLQKDGYYIAATTLHEKAESFETFKLLSQKTAWVFGNEGFGVTETAKKLANTLIYIPMYGFVESLNLSVTVGLVTHKVSAERQKTGVGVYTAEEAKTLSTKWIQRDEKQRMKKSKNDII